MRSPIADATPFPSPAGSRLVQDLGFLAFTLAQVEILRPTKKPRGSELTLAQQRANQALHHRRLRIEHVNSRVKRCRVVKDRSRLWKKGIRDLVMECCCILHNFRVRLKSMAVNGIIGINANRCASYERMRFLNGESIPLRRDKALEEGWGVVCLIYLTSHNRALCALTPLSAEAFRSCHRSRQVAYEAQARTQRRTRAPNRRKERQRPLPAGSRERPAPSGPVWARPGCTTMAWASTWS